MSSFLLLKGELGIHSYCFDRIKKLITKSQNVLPTFLMFLCPCPANGKIRDRGTKIKQSRDFREGYCINTRMRVEGLQFGQMFLHR